MEFPLKYLTLDDRALITEASNRLWFSQGDVIFQQDAPGRFVACFRIVATCIVAVTGSDAWNASFERARNFS